MPTESELTAFVVAVIVGTSVGLLVQRALSRRRPVEVEVPEWCTTEGQGQTPITPVLTRARWTRADQRAYQAACRKEGSA